MTSAIPTDFPKTTGPSSPMAAEDWLRELVSRALTEDLGEGDITSAYFVPETQTCRSQIVARQPGVIAGLEVAYEVFRQIDSGIHVVPVVDDGDALEPGETLLALSGLTRSVLRAERLALNFLQQLSGVATLTRQFVDRIQGTRAMVMDTRKTIPGLRLLQKRAVVAGGGKNHRFGLWDRVMVKDNHLLAGSSPAHLQECLDRLRTDRPGICVEFEADNLQQVRTFLGLRGVDIILLDNMSPMQMREAVELAQGRVRLEASGGVNLDNIRRIAETGVDYISIGSLTHSAPSLDLSMEIIEVV